MTLRARLALLIGALVVATVGIAAGVFTTMAWRAMADQARVDAVAIAGLIARSAAMADQAPLDAEAALGENLAVQAHAIATAIKLAGPVDRQDLYESVATLAARTALDEIWVIDRNGALEISSATPPDQIVAEGFDIAEFPMFLSVLDGTRFDAYYGRLRRPGSDEQALFAAAHRPDTGGMVMVAERQSVLAELTDRIGVQRLIDVILSTGAVDTMWIVDPSRVVLAGATRQHGESGPPVEEGADLAIESIAAAQPRVALTGATLSVAAPVFDVDGIANAAVLLRMPRDHLIEAARDILLSSAGVGVVLLVLGIGAAMLVARQIARPISAVAGAAHALEEGRLDDAALAAAVTRNDEIGRLATAFRNMAAVVLRREEELDGLVRERTAELAEKNEALERAHAQTEAELNAARSLQAAILPREFPTGGTYECRALMEPALHMGGDFYDVVPMDGGRVGLIIADVSGKGVPAAFFMAVSRTVLQSSLRETGRPSQCLSDANDKLCQTNPMEMFVTVFVAVLNIEAGTLTYSNGGHNEPRIVRGADGALETLSSTGDLALGVFEDQDYSEVTVRLDPNDILFLYTDGVTEAMNPEKGEFGETRLDALLKSKHTVPPGSLLTEVRAEVSRFVDGAPQSDDLTCLVLYYRHEGG